MKRRLIDLFWQTGAIQYGDFKLVSGRISHYKIDAGTILLNNEARDIIAKMTFEKIKQEIGKPENYEYAGIFTGGAIYSQLLSNRLGKDHLVLNYKNPITPYYGNVCLNSEYIICEDVVTTGSSIIKSLPIAKSLEIYPKNAVVIVNREEGGQEILENLGITTCFLITKTELSIYDLQS